MRDLDVYLHAELVAQVTFNAGGTPSMRYVSDDALALSLSLPNDGSKLKHSTVQRYFDNLLPDNAVTRGQWADRFATEHGTRVNPNNPFALLEYMGHDAAGAVQVLPKGTVLDTSADLTRVSDQEIARRLSEARRAHGTPDAKNGRGAYSLAGAQSKFALTSFDGGRTFFEPTGAFPSTHIVKPELADYPDSDLVETISQRAGRLAGLDYTETNHVRVGGEGAIVSARFDREVSRGRGKCTVSRLHQEDFAQATGTRPQDKYQADGGPSAVQIARLLEQHADHDSTLRFVDALTYSWAVASTDGHAKNYALVYDRHHRPHFAPVYDVCSYLPFEPERGSRRDNGSIYTGPNLAMSIGGTNQVDVIGERAWRDFAADAGLDEDEVLDHVVRVVHATAPAVDVAARPHIDRPVVRRLVDRVADETAKRAESLPAPSSTGAVFVQAYVRADGTEVAAHYRDRPQR